MRVSRFAALAGVVLVACEHSEPFQLGKYGPTGPRTGGNPVQLTYNVGQDLLPAWLPDGSAFVYTSERLDRVDRDRCLAFMPGGGGSIERYACHTSTSDDSLNVFDEVALSADGRLAYIRSSTVPGLARLGPDAQQLVVAPVGAPDDVTVVLTPPLTTPWGTTYDKVSFIGWLGPSRLVMIGDSVRYPVPCPNCQRDTVATGIEIVTLDFGATPQLSLVPGTDAATSVAVGSTGDTIYFTRAGESAIHRFAFSSTLADSAFDFGSGRVARDIRFTGGTIAAIVDGRVHDGGIIHLVNSGTGADSTLADSAGAGLLWFARPALAPDGRKVVAQGRVLTLTRIVDPNTGMLLGIDTAAASNRNLWLVQR